jgi:hypothetical protein
MRIKSLKTLGLSLLALAGIMVVSASAAQANWQALLNGAVVNSISWFFDDLALKLLVPDLGLTIFCSGGTGTVAITGGGTKTLKGSSSVKFTGCDVEEAEEPCEVFSPGEPDGTIRMSGEGIAGMEGAEIVTFNLSSSKFTEIKIEGEECAAAELDATVSGSLSMTCLEALKDLTIHLLHEDEVSLKYGTHAMKMEGAEGMSAVLGHARDSANPNATFAIHLVGL